MNVVVTGIGLISALGNLETTWKNLLSGESGILFHQPFPELISQPLALVYDQPTEPIVLLEIAIADALKNANLTLPLADCGIVIGSSRGNQGKLEEIAQNPNSKQLVNFPNYLHYNLVLNIAHKIGSTGIVLSPMAACSTGIWAIFQGFELIKTKQYQRVIVGAVESPITRLTLAGFQQMGALAQTGLYPFDRHREGFILGEGGVVFILETEELAQQRSATIYGKILGFGLTNDATHSNKPDSNPKSAIAAIQHCLKRSQLSSHEIDYIHAHGTGTILNDQHEVNLIQKLFSKNVPVSSTKGATGHTLGASGALGVAFCLMALNEQLLPPCVGLKNPEFDLDFVTSVRSTLINNILCFSFGFGGQNAIIAMSKP